MRKLRFIIFSLVILTLAGCSDKVDNGDGGDGGMKKEDDICGGTTNNTDYDAPKTIKSDDLISLSVGFYHEEKFNPSKGMYYTFYLEKDENGKLILKDNSAKEGIEVDESVLSDAQKIIRENGLEKVNGIHKTTAGLPPEFEECFLVAKYSNGESINYSENSDPSAKWSGDFIELFGEIFAQNGDDKYLTPKISETIGRFHLELKEDGKIYSYDTINIPIENKSLEEIAEADDSAFYKKIYRDIYDMDKEEDLGRIMAEPSPKYYEGLLDIISEMEIRDFENYDSFSDLESDEEPAQYYEFYIEFEDESIISGFSADSEVFSEFKPLADELMKYMDEYIENHKEDEASEDANADNDSASKESMETSMRSYLKEMKASHNRNPIDLTPEVREFLKMDEDGMEAISDSEGELYGFEADLTSGCSVWCAVRNYKAEANATSQLAPQGKQTYYASNILDHNRNTAWVEGATGDGIGERISIVKSYDVDAGGVVTDDDVVFFYELCIVNGLARNEKVWKENGRVKSLKFYFNDEYMGTIELEDTMKPQYISLSGLNLGTCNGVNNTFVFEIEDVYPGEKYQDTGITGIEIAIDSPNH